MTEMLPTPRIHWEALRAGSLRNLASKMGTYSPCRQGGAHSAHKGDPEGQGDFECSPSLLEDSVEKIPANVASS